MGHILSLVTYLLITSVSGRVPGYPSYYPAGTRVINYPDTDTAALHMGTAIKHRAPDRVKPSFVIFDIRALWRSGLSVRVPGCQKLQMTA